MQQCVKCDAEATIAGSEGKQVAYCDGCYKEMIIHKFRSALGKRRVFKDGALKEALVVLDGSPASVFLLGQVNEALALDAHRRLVIQPTMVTVVSSLCPSVLSRVAEGDGKCIHVSAILRSSEKSLLQGLSDDNEIQSFERLLNSCTTATARIELMRILRERLILRMANELSLSTVLVSDTADDLARLSLSTLCMGRGGQVTEMTSGVERRKGLATIVRPLKEVRDKEIAHGIRLFQWQGVQYMKGIEEERGTRMENDKASIQTAAAHFVETLQMEGFAATVSTVLSTCSKVHLDVPPSAPLCSLCKRIFTKELTSGICSPCETILDEFTDHSTISHLLQT